MTKWLGTLLLMGGMLGVLAFPLQPIEASPSGIWHRPASGKPLAKVLLVHSIFQEQYTPQLVAQVLAGSGLEVLCVDLHPSGQRFEDQVEYLQRLRRELTGPVYLWGHSMGADLAVAAGRNTKVVAVGFPCESQEQLLQIVGCWDELHWAHEFPQCQISPWSNHSGENYDPWILTRSLRHFGVEPTPRAWLPCVSRMAVMLAGLLLGWGARGEVRYPRAFAAVAATSLLTWPLDPFHSFSLSCAGFLLLARRNDKPLLPIQLASVTLALALGWLVVALPNLFVHFDLLPMWPAAVLFNLSWVLLRSLMSVNLVGLVLFLLIEYLWPGRVFSIVWWLPERAWQWQACRNQGGAQTSPANSKKVWATRLLLLVLLGAAAASWSQVVSEGYLPDYRQMLLLLLRIASLIVIPASVYLGLARRFGGGGGHQNP